MSRFAQLNDYRDLYPSTGDVPTNEQIISELDASCSEIRKHCGGQIFTKVENDEIAVHGTGTAELLLPQLPVIAVNAVTIDKGLATELVVTDYRCELDSGRLCRMSSSPGSCRPVAWPRGFLNITVNNDHGYAVIPPDLIRVAVHLAHERILSGPTRLTGETIAGYSYSQQVGQPSLDDYDDILEPYRISRAPVA